MTNGTKDNGSEQQAAGQLASIREMVAALECDYDRLEELREERDGFEFDPDENAAPDGPGYLNDREAWAGENPDDAEELAALEAAAGECESREDAEQRIHEDALSVEVRSGWYTPGSDLDTIAEEFCILLCTGGPACRIVGDLDGGEPTRARMEHQDWGTPWTEYFESGAAEVLLTYASCFYFGE